MRTGEPTGRRLSVPGGAPSRPAHGLARLLAIEGKAWNHPVLVGDLLMVRNGEEMAAFRLSLAGD